MTLKTQKLTGNQTVMAAAAVVVVGNQFNISIFAPSWLCQYGIIKPEEILGGSVFNPPLVNIPTPNFQLTVLPDRLQIGFPDLASATNASNAERVLGGILRQLPHTPLIAVGINFDCFVSPAPGTNFGVWNKANFASSFALNSTDDSDANGRFGSYFSMDYDTMRLRIEARPVQAVTATSPAVTEKLAGTPHWMHIAFNYQRDLDAKTATNDALDTIAKYDAVISHASSLVKGWE